MRFHPLDILCLVHAVSAISLPFEVHYTPSKRSTGSSLGKRSNLPIKNIANSVYVSNITLGGTTVPVMLDTGSSDLWVTNSIPGSSDTGEAVDLTYAVGTAKGDIFFSDLSIGNFSVSNQAFLYVQDTSSFSADISAQGYDGLMGLGPNTGSAIRKKLDRNDFQGDAVLDRIFQQNKTSSNFISLMLNRNNDPGSTVSGQFTVSEVVSGFENVTSQPKNSIVTVPGLTDFDQHWQLYTDKDGIIGPDGNVIEYDSIVHKAPDGQLVAVIDSGFTLPQVPRSVADAIYGRVQGAEWNTDNEVWTIPCGQLLNISFKFGGVTFPIHPLDTSSSDFGITDSNGQSVCVGTFQPITSAFSLLGEYDIILGMAFLRNSYTLIDLGNFVEGSSRDDVTGYIQMLPLTNVQTAHDDFVKVRLDGQDTTSDPKWDLLPASQGQSSPESSGEKKAHLEEKILSRWPYIFVGSFLGFLLITGLIVWKCCCKRRCAERKKAKAAAAAGVGAAGAGAGASAAGASGMRMRGSNRLSVANLQMNPLKNPESSYYPIHDSASASDVHLPQSPSYPHFQTQPQNHNSHPPSFYSQHSQHSGFSEFSGAGGGYNSGYGHNGFHEAWRG